MDYQQTGYDGNGKMYEFTPSSHTKRLGVKWLISEAITEGEAKELEALFCADVEQARIDLERISTLNKSSL
ncbi:MAG: hypothetical protein ACP5D2_02635 [Candidatus Nanoarchaeia archaeon]